MIQKRDLQRAISLARHRHFGRAAATLGITQPALSRSIRTLEESLGVKLFDRTGREVAPTVFGRLLIARGTTIVRDLDDLERELQLIQQLEVGHLNLGLGPYPAELSGHTAVGRALRKHPGLNFRVHVTDWQRIHSMVSDRTVDLGLAEISDVELDRRFHQQVVGVHRACFFCRSGHPLAGRREAADLRSVLDYPWASTALPPRISSAVPDPPGAAGRIDPESGNFLPAIQLDVVSRIKIVVAESDAIGLAPPLMLERELASGELAIIPTAFTELRTRYGFIRLRERALSPSAKLYMQMVTRIEGELADRQKVLEETYLGSNSSVRRESPDS